MTPVRDFKLPDLGEGLEEAEVVAWRVKEGDPVELNQILVEVNTEKALVEVPSPWEGVVERLHAAEGDIVKVGRPLVSIRVEGSEEESPAEAAGEDRPKRQAVLVGYGVEEEGTTAPTARAGAPERERKGPVPTSPPVRRLAKELGVDLAAVAGTGPGGRLTREDVLRAASRGGPPVGEATREAPPRRAGEEEAERVPVRGTRRLIAEKMARAAREVPAVTTFLTVDASAMQAFRREIQQQSGQRISPLPIVVRALAEVCREFPRLNSSFDTERSEILLYERCHVGIATDTEQGLLAPVVRDAGAKGILEIAGDIDRLAEAARAGKSKPEDLMGSTITVTNVGTFGAEFGTPIVNYPEAAILALGVIEPRALVVDGAVEARPTVTLSLTFDHRVLDGAEAGRALAAFREILVSPFRLGALPRLPSTGP